MISEMMSDLRAQYGDETLEAYGNAYLARHPRVKAAMTNSRVMRKCAKALGKDKCGEVSIKSIVAIVVGLFVVATIVPTALTTLANSTLTGVDPAVTTVLKVLLPILAVIAIAIMFLNRE